MFTASPRATARLGLVGAVLTAALAGGALAQPAAATTSGAASVQSASSVTSTGVSRADAKFLVMGYLWGDGRQMSNGDWTFRSTTATVADRFALAASQSGARVARSMQAGRYLVTISGFTPAVPHSSTPPLLAPGAATATPSALKAFLAGVIEGEGSRAGLVLDDPERTRGTAMRALLGRVGIRTYMEGNTYVRVYAQQADFPVFQTFPFCVWTRVPGGH